MPSTGIWELPNIGNLFVGSMLWSIFGGDLFFWVHTRWPPIFGKSHVLKHVDMLMTRFWTVYWQPRAKQSYKHGALHPPASLLSDVTLEINRGSSGRLAAVACRFLMTFRWGVEGAGSLTVAF